MRDSTEKRFWSKVDIKSPELCWPWKACIPIRNNRIQGYGTFKLNKKSEFAHRVAYLLTYGEIPVGMVVMHTCDNPSCCNPHHLKVGTVFDNNKDKLRKGRHRFGGLNPKKLTEEQAEEIRRLNPPTYDYWKVGKNYGVSRFVIYQIINRKGAYK